LLSAATVATTAFAADESKEQCAGVIKAGKNDCGHQHECLSRARRGRCESDGLDLSAKGTCEKIAGAHVVKVTEPTPKKARTRAGEYHAITKPIRIGSQSSLARNGAALDAAARLDSALE